MAIGPNHNIQKKRIARTEKMIDDILKSYPNQSVVTVCVKLVGLFYGDFPILEEKYIKAGWGSVEYMHDQRDGDYLKFRAEKAIQK